MGCCATGPKWPKVEVLSIFSFIIF
jgi:hypothetical protein